MDDRVRGIIELGDEGSEPLGGQQSGCVRAEVSTVWDVCMGKNIRKDPEGAEGTGGIWGDVDASADLETRRGLVAEALQGDGRE